MISWMPSTQPVPRALEEFTKAPSVSMLRQSTSAFRLSEEIGRICRALKMPVEGSAANSISTLDFISAVHTSSSSFTIGASGKVL